MRKIGPSITWRHNPDFPKKLKYEYLVMVQDFTGEKIERRATWEEAYLIDRINRLDKLMRLASKISTAACQMMSEVKNR